METKAQLEFIKQISKQSNTVSRKEEDNKVLEDIPKEEWKGIMSSTNVGMVVPKTYVCKDILLAHFSVNEDDLTEIPNIDYTENGYNKGSIYCCDYMRIVLEIAKHYENVLIKQKEDFPLWVETKDFVYILAPRVGEVLQ
jgi:hypothetical protein